jgi:hypothetical protein
MTAARFVVALVFLALLPSCSRQSNSPSSSDRQVAELQKQVVGLQKALQASRATPTPPSEDNTAAKEVYRQLVKLESATQTGLNYPQYCERLLDAKGEIEATLPRVQNYGFRKNAEQALAIYIDAPDLWSFFTRETYHQLSELEKSQFEKYKLNIIPYHDGGYVGSSQVPVIWSYASAIVDRMGATYPDLLR